MNIIFYLLLFCSLSSANEFNNQNHTITFFHHKSHLDCVMFEFNGGKALIHKSREYRVLNENRGEKLFSCLFEAVKLMKDYKRIEGRTIRTVGFYSFKVYNGNDNSFSVYEVPKDKFLKNKKFRDFLKLMNEVYNEIF